MLLLLSHWWPHTALFYGGWCCLNCHCCLPMLSPSPTIYYCFFQNLSFYWLLLAVTDYSLHCKSFVTAISPLCSNAVAIAPVSLANATCHYLLLSFFIMAAVIAVTAHVLLTNADANFFAVVTTHYYCFFFQNFAWPLLSPLPALFPNAPPLLLLLLAVIAS